MYGIIVRYHGLRIEMEWDIRSIFISYIVCSDVNKVSSLQLMKFMDSLSFSCTLPSLSYPLFPAEKL